MLHELTAVLHQLQNLDQKMDTMQKTLVGKMDQIEARLETIEHNTGNLLP